MRVLAIGDSVIDVYRNQGIAYPGGNALNVAVNAARLGHKAAYLGSFASDAQSLFLRGFLMREGVTTERCPVVSGTATKRCVEDVVDGERHFVCVDEEGWVGPLALSVADLAYAQGFDLVLTSVNARMTGQLGALGEMPGLVAFDLGEKDKYRTPELLATLAQVADVVQLSADDLDGESLQRVVGPLAEHALVIVTRGSSSTLLAWQGGQMEVAVDRVSPVDTMGAGDAYLAAFACALAERGWRAGKPIGKGDLGQIARTAGAWAARTCLSHGGFESPYEGPEAVVFDMDGVLVASEAVWENAFRCIFAERGFELTEAERVELYGCSDEHEKEMVARKLGISVEEGGRIRDRYLAEHPVRYDRIAIQGVRPALERLHELGIRTAIATSSPAEAAERMVFECGLEGLFDAVVTSSEVDEAKPNPAIYLCAAQKLGVAPSRCLAVDDSAYGFESALRAGMATVHFRGQATPELPGDRQKDIRATCSSHEDVVAVVEAMAAQGQVLSSHGKRMPYRGSWRGEQ